MNNIIPVREKLIEAVKRGESITKRQYYGYCAISMVEGAVDVFLEDTYSGDDDKVYDSLQKIADPISEELSKIPSDRMIKKRLIALISTFNTGLNRREIKLLAEEITHAEIHSKKECRSCPVGCLFDPDGDATDILIKNEPELYGIKELLDLKKPVEIKVLHEEFEDDIIRLDNILMERRNMNLNLNLKENSG